MAVGRGVSLLPRRGGQTPPPHLSKGTALPLALTQRQITSQVETATSCGARASPSELPWVLPAVRRGTHAPRTPISPLGQRQSQH